MNATSTRPLQDLRLRIIAAFAAIACVSQLQALPVAAGAFAAVLLGAVLSRAALPWHRLLHVEGFLLLLFATLPFTVSGQPLFSVGPLTVSEEGVRRAALVACKVSASALIMMSLLHGVEPARLGQALRSLYLPEAVVRLFVLTARYVSLIRDEAVRLNDAMRMRGFRPRSNGHTWRSYGNLVGMLLVRALDRAQKIEEAMLCRGYHGRFPRLAEPTPARRDWAGFGAIIGCAAVLLLVDRL